MCKACAKRARGAGARLAGELATSVQLVGHPGGEQAGRYPRHRRQQHRHQPLGEAPSPVMGGDEHPTNPRVAPTRVFLSGGRWCEVQQNTAHQLPASTTIATQPVPPAAPCPLQVLAPVLGRGGRLGRRLLGRRVRPAEHRRVHRPLQPRAFLRRRLGQLHEVVPAHLVYGIITGGGGGSVFMSSMINVLWLLLLLLLLLAAATGRSRRMDVHPSAEPETGSIGGHHS
jgi:hypothetical protein